MIILKSYCCVKIYNMTLKVDSQITSLLSAMDLSETEQKLYLAGLQTQEASVNFLVQQTGVNRTTAYHALGTLKQKGFVTEGKVLGRLIYQMVSPKDLERVLSSRQAQLETHKRQVLELEHLFPASSDQVQVTQIEKFDGLEGVKLAIEKALYCSSRQWNIIAPRDNFFNQIDQDYAVYFMKTRRSRKINARTLWESDGKNEPQLSLEDLMLRKPRYLHADFKGKFEAVVIMFDDKALFIPPLNNRSAVLVHSQDIVSTLNVMFEALWLSSDKPL